MDDTLTGVPDGRRAALNSPGFTNGVGAVARGASGASGQKTEVSYLGPGERCGHDVAVRVNLETGVQIEEVLSRSHSIVVEKPSSGQTMVQLSPHDAIPNKDFVLRWRVAGDRVMSHLLTHRDERGGFFTLLLYPPRELQSRNRQPLELVFVLDCSGSMRGQPLAQAKAAITRALDRLQPGDSFQLINFSEDASPLGPAPLEATLRNVRHGQDYLHSLNSDGGTMMIEGIQAALDFPHDPWRLRFVCFITDGFIGNESQILGEIHRRFGATRIFSFGVGFAPNRYLLNGMARLGSGAAAYLGLRDDAAAVMDDFFDRVSHPALTDVKMDWGAMEVSEVFPQKMSLIRAGVSSLPVRKHCAVPRPVVIARPASNVSPPSVPQLFSGSTLRHNARSLSFRRSTLCSTTVSLRVPPFGLGIFTCLTGLGT